MRKKAKKQPVKYRGSVSFPLMGAMSQAHFIGMQVKTGDFLDPSLEKKIYSRARYYKIETHLCSSEGLGWDVVESVNKQLLTKPELAKAIASVAKQHLESFKDSKNPVMVNARKSFVKIILC